MNLMSPAHPDLAELQRSLEIAFALSGQDAEDIVTEAMLVVVTKWGADGMGDAQLLQAVARNVARNLLRSRARRGEIPLDLSNEPFEAHQPELDRAFAEALLLGLCRAAGIDSAEDIRLLKLALLDDWSYNDLSHTLSASEDALRQRVSRLRRRLRDAYLNG
jgi:DNA-directed RNA polymerase specialized sigma24 family protein